jgi:hypothetical protein
MATWSYPMAISPWDGGNHEVQVLRAEEHCIVGVYVSPPASGDDDRFAIEFRTDGGRTLRVRLPGDHLEALGQVLLDLAKERWWGQ